MIRFTWVISLSFFFMVLSGCGHCKMFCHKNPKLDTPPKPQTAVVNPNGDSELALLMRKMTDALASKKLGLMKGEGTEITEDFTGIFTAKATSPHMKNKSFEGFAKSLMYQLENYNAIKNIRAYNSIVQTCVACHQQSCPGPIDRINKLMIYL